MPIPFSYPETSWSQRKLRTRGDIELAADIQRRSQSQVRGWDDESKDESHDREQRRRPNFAEGKTSSAGKR
jgi:hypothetical protein